MAPPAGQDGESRAKVVNSLIIQHNCIHFMYVYSQHFRESLSTLHPKILSLWFALEEEQMCLSCAVCVCVYLKVTFI